MTPALLLLKATAILAVGLAAAVALRGRSAASRHAVLAASLAVLLLSACAAWGTASGVGPFAGHDTHAGLLALWSYITRRPAPVCLSAG